MTEVQFLRWRKSLAGVVLFLLIAGGLVFLWTSFISPRFRLKRIVLESSLELTDQDLLVMGGLDNEQSILALDIDEVRSRYESSPLIRKAYVEKQLPETLKLVLYGRSPLGQIFLPGTFSSLVFDEYGVVYHGGIAEPCTNLPVLSGVKVEDGRLPEALKPLLRDMKRLQKKTPLLFNQISEICVKRVEGTLNELELFVNAYRLPVILGGTLPENLMKKILLVLDSLESGNLLDSFEYADFRADKVVLKEREGL